MAASNRHNKQMGFSFDGKKAVGQRPAQGSASIGGQNI